MTFEALAAPILVLALAFDGLYGELPSRVHPVVAIGHSIGFLEARAPKGPVRELLYGTFVGLGLPAAFAMIVHVATAWAQWGPQLAVQVPMVAVHVLVLSSCFARRELGAAGRELERACIRDLEHARFRLRWLCSRDAAQLDRAQLRAAGVESLAENASDSVVAPLFWYALFGLEGAVAYRVVNTLDAMWGYRGRYEWLGKVPARLDDVVNWIPARLTALAVALILTARGHPLDWAGVIRDARSTPSPNAGWPMAMVAHGLGLELSKPDGYCLNPGGRACSEGEIERAWAIVDRACWLVAGLICLWIVIQNR